ncbi:MAG: hypothetical protein IJ295_02090 [Clostridia bacterium]|nr:hypothetical protein [Clostridia bacterium]
MKLKTFSCDLKSSDFNSKYLRDRHFQILDDILGLIFPDKNQIIANLKTLKRSDKRQRFDKDGLPIENDFLFEYNQKTLCFFSRSPEVLVKYINKILKEIRAGQVANQSRENNQPVQKIPFIDEDVIIDYINKSENFKKRMDEYEFTVVTELINSALDENVDSFCISREQKMKMAKYSDYDEVFRNRIISAVDFMGMGTDFAEDCLEIRRDLWLENVRQKTFANNICRAHANKINQQKVFLKEQKPELFQDLLGLRESVYQSWCTLREQEYCRKHHKVVKKWRENDSVAQLSLKQLEDLRYKVCEQMSLYEFEMFKTVTMLDAKDDRNILQ